MESESSRFTDELNIYRSYLERQPGRQWTTSGGRQQLMSANCGKIHRYRDNYMEQAGKYTYEGHRQVVSTSPGHVVSQVSFRVGQTRLLVLSEKLQDILKYANVGVILRIFSKRI